MTSQVETSRSGKKSPNKSEHSTEWARAHSASVLDVSSRKMLSSCAPLALVVLAVLLGGCDNKTTNAVGAEAHTENQADVTMIKLYKKKDGLWHYHEAWIGDSDITEHWGTVGDRGSTREHPIPSGIPESAALRKVLKKAYADGFEEVDLNGHAVLLVEYAVVGFGSPEDLDKRHRLQDRLNETLGWTGLGYCDGGSIGSDTMEAACYVIDFSVAKSVVEKDLEGTEFQDFTRIYDEGDPRS